MGVAVGSGQASLEAPSGLWGQACLQHLTAVPCPPPAEGGGRGASGRRTQVSPPSGAGLLAL